MANLSLSLVEIAVLMVGAITLGFTIHFFISSRRSFQVPTNPNDKIVKSLEEWKLRYYKDIELKDREVAELRKKTTASEDNNEINIIEAEELRRLNKKLAAEIEILRNTTPGAGIGKGD